jgi:hypothetical protein
MAARHSASMDARPKAGPQTWSWRTMAASAAVSDLFHPVRFGENVPTDIVPLIDATRFDGLRGRVSEVARPHVAIRQADTTRPTRKISRTPLTECKSMRTQRGSSASALPPQPPIPHTLRISPRQFFQSSDCGERVSASDLQSTRSPASSNPYRVPVPTGHKNRFRPSQKERSSTLRTSRRRCWREQQTPQFRKE